jgi:glycosyltransferase involved in cell wall biosynthesis
MLSLVIPVYNNAQNLPRLFTAIETLAGRFPGGLEVVFVVDGSPDDSLAILRTYLARRTFPAKLIELSRNFGAFPAIAAGLRHGSGDYFAVLAADLQEPPELIVEFARLMREDKADIVIGERRQRADPLWSRAMSILFWKFYRRFVIPDLPAGGVDVFGCTRAVRDRLVEMKEVNTSLVGLLFWLGFRRMVVQYDRQAREGGRSGWTLQKKWRYALDSVFNFSDLPIRVLLVLGSVATVLAVVASTTVLVFWQLGLIPVLGYTPLMLAVATFGGLTSLGLGIVGQYLWLALQNARNRPAFVVRSIEDFEQTL